MTFERTRDVNLIRWIMTNPRIWRHITDDGSPAPDQWTPADPEVMWYVVARDSEELLGLWMLAPRGSAELEIHTCLLPCAWGARALVAAAGVVAWIWDNTIVNRIVTTVPEYNRLALRLALRSGMAEYGRDPKSYLKDGKLNDQILLGMSRPEGK